MLLSFYSSSKLYPIFSTIWKANYPTQSLANYFLLLFKLQLMQHYWITNALRAKRLPTSPWEGSTHPKRAMSVMLSLTLAADVDLSSGNAFSLPNFYHWTDLLTNLWGPNLCVNHHNSSYIPTIYLKYPGNCPPLPWLEDANCNK